LKEGNKRDRAKLKSHNAKDYQALKIKHETDQKLEADLKTAKQGRQVRAGSSAVRAQSTNRQAHTEAAKVPGLSSGLRAGPAQRINSRQVEAGGH
jgi:hypothetical protein